MINEIGRRDHPDQPVRRPARHDPPRRRPQLRPQDRRDVRPDRLRAGRLAGAALGLFEPPPGELPVHRAGVPRRQGTAEARRRVRDVQLLPPGLGRRPAGGDGREGLRRRSRSSSRCRTRTTIKPGDDAGGATSRSCSPASRARSRSTRSARRLEDDESFWLNERPRDNEAINGFGPSRPTVRGRPSPRLAEDRPGRGRHDAASADCRPTTGRSSTSASRRSRR